MTEPLLEKVYGNGTVSLFRGDYTEALSSCGKDTLLIMDPPFDMWCAISELPGVATTIAFTNLKNRKHVERLLGEPRAELVWVFGEGRWVSRSLPRQTHETILVFGRTGNATAGDKAVNKSPQSKGKTSIGKWSCDKGRVYTPKDRKMVNSHIAEPRRMASGLTSWSKPIRVMEQLIRWNRFDNTNLVDPFCGTGTSLLCCSRMGVPAIGADIDEKMLRVAINRLMEAT